ncbi:MAG: PAS domain-containing protein [Gemmataceae bacterium]
MMTFRVPPALLAALAPLPQCVYLADARGRCVFANPALSRWLQRDEHDLVGRPLKELWPDPFAALEESDLRSVLAGQVCHQIETRPGPQGNRQVRSIKYRWAMDQQVPLAVVLFEEHPPSVHHVSPIEPLVSILTREINQSLLMLRGHLASIERLHPEAQEDLTMMNLLLDQAATLPRRLSAMLGEETRPRQRLEIQTLLRSLACLLRSQTSQGSPVELDLCSEECWILGDPIQLTETLLSLAGTVADPGATHQPLRISSQRKGAFVRIVVECENPGHGEAPSSRASALGLALVYELVRRHQGRLSCVAEPATGSRFVLELPLLSESDLAQSRGMALVIEDDSTVAHLTRLMLEHGNYTVHTRTTLVGLKDQPADILIVCAHHLQGVGLRDLQAWLARYPAARVLLTTTGLAHEIPASCQSRIRGILRKPYRTETLLVALANL